MPPMPSARICGLAWYWWECENLDRLISAAVRRSASTQPYLLHRSCCSAAAALRICAAYVSGLTMQTSDHQPRRQWVILLHVI
jgi:hypothetical protein